MTQNLIIPSYHRGINDNFNWDEVNDFAVLTCLKNGKIKINSINESFIPLNWDRLIKWLSKSKSVFYWAEDANLLSYLLWQCAEYDIGFLGEMQILMQQSKIDEGRYIWHTPGQGKVTIRDGAATNCYHMYSTNSFSCEPLETPDKIKKFYSTLKRWCLMNSINLNPVSMQSTSRQLQLEMYPEENQFIRGLDSKLLFDFRNASYGAFHESSIIGSPDDIITNYDMVKSHLNIAASKPVLDFDTYIEYGTEHDPNASYELATVRTISRREKFPLIPYRRNRMYAPVGLLPPIPLTKEYISELGNRGIPYQIKGQILKIYSTSGKTHKALTDKIIKAIDNAHPWINSRMLYLSVVGSSNHIRGGGGGLTTVPTFNSILYSSVLASQNCATKDLLDNVAEKKQYARRADAVSIGKDLGSNIVANVGHDEYIAKKAEKGRMLWYTNMLKDKGDSDHYRDLVYKHRDEKFIEIKYSYYPTVHECYRKNYKLGLREITFQLPPNPGARRLKKEINKIGELLEGSIRTYAPQMEEVDEMDNNYEKTSWSKLEEITKEKMGFTSSGAELL